MLPYINTEQAARDFHLIRHLLGYDQADMYGVSYGSWLESVIERMFPQTYDRVILDGNGDWQSGSMETAFGWQAQGFQAANDRQLLPFFARHDDIYRLGTTPLAVNG